jgi:hypothetical protein
LFDRYCLYLTNDAKSARRAYRTNQVTIALLEICVEGNLRIIFLIKKSSKFGVTKRLVSAIYIVSGVEGAKYTGTALNTIERE